MNRRDYMTAVAGLAAARWDQEGIDPTNMEPPLRSDGSQYTTGEFTPKLALAGLNSKFVTANLEPEDFSEHSARIQYNSDGVTIDAEAQGQDYFQAGVLFQFEPDEARELAAAIFQAAEELDRQRGGE